MKLQQFRVLSDSELSDIHKASLKLLSKTGMKV
ncbi:unnamed protein product, partial [marine sediment metagenome]